MTLVAALLFGAAVAANAPVALPRASVVIDGHSFIVEVAATPATRAHGLMERERLPANAGMWFVFEKAAPRSFWMKNTPVALDMLFFDANRRLVSMQVNVPPCLVEQRCPLYPSGEAAKYVLEVPAGTAWRLDLRRGAVASVTGNPDATR